LKHRLKFILKIFFFSISKLNSRKLEFKGELGEFQIYLRKIPLHQQNFLLVSVLSNSLQLRRNLKNVQNENTKLFSWQHVSVATVQARIFCVCLLYDDMN